MTFKENKLMNERTNKLLGQDKQRQREGGKGLEVRGEGLGRRGCTNRGTQRYCRVYFAPRAPRRPFLRAAERCKSAFSIWTLSHTLPSTNSTGTTPPTARALQ